MIQIQRLRKAWPRFALEIERLDIRTGEYFVVLGPSGAGKTVLLSCLAGILRPDRGRIHFDERDVTELPPERRSIGWVSQFNTLFPHLTVAGNIGFARRYSPAGGERFDQRVARLVELLDLGSLLERHASDLSGGEVQRAMLARSLVLQPRVLLLDEPLRGLDPTTQDRLRDELTRIHRELGTTTFHITHDHVEARALADRIAVLRGGRIEQIGDADEVFERPVTCFVARFTGTENLFALAGSGAGKSADGQPIIDRQSLPPGLVADDATHIAVRPEHVEIWPDATAGTDAASGSLRLEGTIESLAQHGGWLRVTVRCGRTLWTALVHPRDAKQRHLRRDAPVTISIAHENICAIDEKHPERTG